MPEHKRVGWSFPLRVDSTNGKIVTTDEKEDVKQSLFVLLSTRKGERIMNPEYGCDLQQFAFETVTYALISKMEKEIITAIRNFEPRVGGLDITFHKGNEKNNDSSEKIIVEINYTILETDETDSISYSVVINS